MKKNGDAPEPLGDFVKWLVTERTPKKRNTNKEKRNRKDITKTSLIFTKDVNINFI